MTEWERNFSNYTKEKRKSLYTVRDIKYIKTIFSTICFSFKIWNLFSSVLYCFFPIYISQSVVRLSLFFFIYLLDGEMFFKFSNWFRFRNTQMNDIVDDKRHTNKTAIQTKRQIYIEDIFLSLNFSIVFKWRCERQMDSDTNMLLL